MGTIKTIQNLLKLNGSAQSATVSLIQSDERLIAAAPEMLEALERAKSALDDAFSNSGLNTVENESYYEAYELVRSAIAKARGES